MWQCSRCNFHNEDNSKFCSGCGAKQSNKNTFYQPEEPVRDYIYKKKSNLPIILSITSILIVLIICSAVVILSITKEIGNTNNGKTDSNDQISDSSLDENPVSPEKAPSSTDVEQNQESTDEATTESTETYYIYTNDEYNFYCAYPSSFHIASQNGVNALQTYVSPDQTATMTIRASENTNNISIEQALQDFHNAYVGSTTYETNGETWYASSIANGNRLHYRKFFIKNGNMYCMDFEFFEEDLNIYSTMIEYIEDNFKAN